MITVKAIYENGGIRLLEDVPLQEHQQLLITLIEDKNKSDKSVRSITLLQPDSFKDYLNDEREDLYQDYLITSR